MKNLLITTDKLEETGTLQGSVDTYTCDTIKDSVQRQDLRISYTLSRAGEENLLRGEVRGEIYVSCCRCLKDYAFPVQVSFAQSYPENVTEIDLGDEANQAVVLSLPSKPLCSEECKGICPTCGKDRNITSCSCAEEHHDPRWDKLKTIIKKK